MGGSSSSCYHPVAKSEDNSPESEPSPILNSKFGLLQDNEQNVITQDVTQEGWTSSDATLLPTDCKHSLIKLEHKRKTHLNPHENLKNVTILKNGASIIGLEIPIKGLGLGYIDSILSIGEDNLIFTLIQMRDGRQYVLPIIQDEEVEQNEKPDSKLLPAADP